MTRRLRLIIFASVVLAGLTLVIAKDDAPAEPTDPGGANPADSVTVVTDELLGRGRVLFHQNCASCHGADGSGAAGPSFHDNPDVGDAEYLIDMVLHGGSFMTPFRQVLDDEEVATVVTFVRNSWGNEYAPVSAESVAAQR